MYTQKLLLSVHVYKYETNKTAPTEKPKIGMDTRNTPIGSVAIHPD